MSPAEHSYGVKWNGMEMAIAWHWHGMVWYLVSRLFDVFVFFLLTFPYRCCLFKGFSAFRMRGCPEGSSRYSFPPLTVLGSVDMETSRPGRALCVAVLSKP